MLGLMMDYPLTIDRILEHANRMHPRKRITTKLPNGQLHRYTYAQLHQRARRLGNVLERLGVRLGDRVGTFAWNHYQHMELYYGVPGCGGVCHTLNIRLSPEQLAYIVDHAGDKVVFVEATLLPLFEAVAARVRSPQAYVLINAEPGTETTLPSALNYEELMAEVDDDFEWRSRDENAAAALCYTSGTTGGPKGVLYSHRSTYLHAMGENQAGAIGLTERDVVLPIVPMFHVMGWGLPYAAAMAGAELILPGPQLKPDVVAELIEEEKVTVAAGVPTIWTALYRELKARPRDVSSIRALLVGGAAMPRALIEAFENELGVNVLHAWGMTETSPSGTMSILQRRHLELAQDERLDVKAKQGSAVPGVEMRLVNEGGDELPWDGTTMGEVQVRGPWVAGAYYRIEPGPDSFTDDGWFRTGDVATIDRHGFMQITDRTKDLVKSGGEWISSMELENALMAHSGVAEAAVIAIPDEKWGERPLAVVVRASEGKAVDEGVLRELLEPRFARFWLPEKYAFVAEIPKTSVGKFDKKVLRHRHADGLL